MNLGSWWRKAITEDNTSLGVRLLLGALRPWSWLYSFVAAGRNWAYDKKILSSFQATVPIVSIGNIAVGGTGKTPVIRLLAEELIPYGRLAIISRGYKSQASKQKNPLALSLGEGPRYNCHIAGDEPYMLSKAIPEALFFVGKDRVKGAGLASKYQADLILLDDGLQHRRLSRDYDLIVMDGRDLLGGGACLPRGSLREDPRGLKRAHLIIVNHLQSSDEYFRALKAIRQYANCPVVGGRPKTTNLRMLNTPPCKHRKGKKVAAFCGIAKPERFVELLQEEGYEVGEIYFVGDHDNFNLECLQQFALQAQKSGCQMLICTEKDLARLPEDLEMSLPVGILGMKLKIDYGINEWHNFVTTIKARMKRS
ncbi:MAG: tetraacyldisaccharide 4'-kinase [Chlamydiota bacterium]